MSGNSRTSDNPNNFPDPRQDHETADRIWHEILNNRPPPDESVSPSSELYRAIERYHRNRRVENRNSIRGTTSNLMSSEQEAERRRSMLREWNDASSLFVVPNQPRPSASNTRERPTARRAVTGSARRANGRILGGDRYLERQRRLNEESAEMQHASEQLQAASSSLRSLLDDTVPRIPSPSLQAEEYSEEAEHNRRTKRRKYDYDRLDNYFTGFSYGKYGQVEPGKLKMEIVSCDGGMYQDYGGDYCAENVLKNDNSVYCTKSNRCNLILRHQGATVFSLKELIIKAPHSGYTAPIQEGVVFLSMNSDDLLTRTAQYQIQYSSPRNPRPSSPPLNELPPIMSIRHDSDSSGLIAARMRARRLVDIGAQDDECDYRSGTAQIPSEFNVTGPPFEVSTEVTEPESEDESRPSRRTPFRITIRQEEEESSEEEPNSGVWHEDYLLGMGRSPRQRQRDRERARERDSRRENPSNTTLAEAAEASQIATQEAVRAVGGELMAPIARFFIERGKSQFTVRFDTPLSGRFILLKMWSPHDRPTANIDIQSVVAKGYAGPRFFPAVELA